MPKKVKRVLVDLVEMGRKGGSAKVPKGLSKLSKKQRKQIAKMGAAARWGNKSEKS